jgi:hypothetical protein
MNKTAYASDQIEQMRVALAEYWSENLAGAQMQEILYAGSEGYKNLKEDTLIEEFELVFGENYFWED